MRYKSSLQLESGQSYKSKGLWFSHNPWRDFSG